MDFAYNDKKKIFIWFPPMLSVLMSRASTFPDATLLTVAETDPDTINTNNVDLISFLLLVSNASRQRNVKTL